MKQQVLENDKNVRDEIKPMTYYYRYHIFNYQIFVV